MESLRPTTRPTTEHLRPAHNTARRWVDLPYTPPAGEVITELRRIGDRGRVEVILRKIDERDEPA